MKKLLHHYTEGGLDCVYLIDGFEIVRTGHRPTVQIESASNLDRAIALHLVRFQKQLSGGEVRFFRGLLDWTQEELGRALGKDAQTVARWEKGKTRLPLLEDVVIRQIYLEQTGYKQKFIETICRVNALTERLRSLIFKVSDDRRGRPPSRSKGAANQPCGGRETACFHRDTDADVGPDHFAVTLQIVFERSSAMIKAPRGSTVTPTGRPRALPSSSRNPTAKSIGSPAGRPSRNGTKITL
jgi:putative transcriptional regulator